MSGTPSPEIAGALEALGGADAQPAGGPADLSPCGSQPVGAHQAQGEWIEWKGGECPVDPGTHVEVRMAYGGETSNFGLRFVRAEILIWEHGLTTDNSDIIAYRVIGGAE